MPMIVSSDGVEISDKSFTVIFKYKSVLENICDLVSDPEGKLDKILKEDVLSEDLELMTAFADMTAAIVNFKKIANKR